MEAGGFTLFPAIELIGGYDTNPAGGHRRRGACSTPVAPELRAQSNWSRHELKADLRGSYTGYSPRQTPTLSRPNFNGKVDGRIDVTHDTRIDLGTRYIVATDNPGQPKLAGRAFQAAGVHHIRRQRRARPALQPLRGRGEGRCERTIYQNSSLTDGSTASNEDRQYNQYTGTLRGSYESTPG